ncbi:MAG: hypothetical protein N2554_08240 [Fimbriimonadales bacterium]|nr:hypothetical protein [Fimbriimonadales bacterium]
MFTLQYRGNARVAARNGFLVGLLTTGLTLSASAQTLTWLGVLDDYSGSSIAYSVSADGGVVVGVSKDDFSYRYEEQTWRAFRWTPDDGMINLGTLGGPKSAAYGVSADGNIVVGTSSVDSLERLAGFVWRNGTLQSLGVNTFVNAVSADGRVMVGGGTLPGLSGVRAIRWVNGRAQDLGPGIAYGVSPDGRFVVGQSNGRAFRWNSGRILDLGPGVAYGVSANGRVVVGESSGRAVRWVNGVKFDIAPGAAYGVSADGNLIVGGYNYNWYAFRWTPTRGLEDLNDVFDETISGCFQCYMSEARAVSADGRYIVGQGRGPVGAFEAFLLDTQP